MPSTKLNKFIDCKGNSYACVFVETQSVKDGVECDLYNFVDDNTRDLAVVRVDSGFKTPLQLVVKGSKTIEGFCSGAGTLTVWDKNGNTQQFTFADGNESTEVIVAVGQKMQWHADKNMRLEFYEICDPPYKDGRFENLPE